MSKETLARVFEPFFTTKDVGRGTGLGLSMVYGFVKQSGGHITIYSEEGQGTTVKLYFPRHVSDEETLGEAPEQQTPPASQDEVVLVVEDNPDVRAFSVMCLTELGYEVLQASDAERGLEILQGDRRIDLLFTDVVLPGRTGRVLADGRPDPSGPPHTLHHGLLTKRHRPSRPPRSRRAAAAEAVHVRPARNPGA